MKASRSARSWSSDALQAHDRRQPAEPGWLRRRRNSGRNGNWKGPISTKRNATRPSSGSSSRRMPASRSSRTATVPNPFRARLSGNGRRHSTGPEKPKWVSATTAYVVDVPTVTGPLRRGRPVHRDEAAYCGAHEKGPEMDPSRPDDDLRYACRRPLRQTRRHGDGVRRRPQRGSPGTRSRRRRHDQFDEPPSTSSWTT
jgi:hypothetical protein